MQETNRGLLSQLAELRRDNELNEVKHQAEQKAVQRRMDEHTSFYYEQFNKLHLHVSCLGCDLIKNETMKLLCGHNICRSCLNKYSSSEHPKSSVRCEVCQIETKVVLLTISIPNRAICQILIDTQIVLGRKFYSGAIRHEQSQNAREEVK